MTIFRSTHHYLSGKSNAFLTGMAVCAAFCVYSAFLQLAGNFHEIVPGEFYRSAQFDPVALHRYVQKYHIASVINLRGENPGRIWYQEEIQAARSDHVLHYDFPMSSKHRISPAEAQRLIALMHAAPKPVLIHCRSGSDRTGLASALYLASKGDSEFAAEMQLSPIYGHFPFHFIGAPEMDASFESMEPAFGYTKS